MTIKQEIQSINDQTKQIASVAQEIRNMDKLPQDNHPGWNRLEAAIEAAPITSKLSRKENAMTLRDIDREFQKHRERWPNSFWSVTTHYANFGTKTEARYDLYFWTENSTDSMQATSTPSLTDAFDKVSAMIAHLTQLAQADEMDAVLGLS